MRDLIEFLKAKFDLLLLTAFVVMFSWYAVHGVGDGFATRCADLFIGGMLGLITGRNLPGPKPPANPPQEEEEHK